MPNTIKRLSLCILVAIIFLNTLLPQQYSFRRYSVEEGLPLSSLLCLMQDSRGYIWMGTEGAGIIRFDGNRFETFTTSDGLSDNIVYNITEASNGNIWIGTFNGITVYDGAVFKTIGREQGFTGNNVMKITEGHDKAIWVATADAGLFRLSLGDSLSIKNYSTYNGLSSYWIKDIFEAEDKRLWLATAIGVNILEFDESLKIKEVTRLNFPVVGDSLVTLCVEPDKDNSVWIGSHYGRGLYRAKPAPGGKDYTVEPSAVNAAIPGMSVWNILTEENGDVWIATEDDGVIRMNDDLIIERFNTGNGLPSDQVLDIIKDKEDNHWFATLGQGTIMFDDNKFLSYGNREGLQGKQIMSVLTDDDGIIYIGSEQGLATFRKDNETLTRLDVYNESDGLKDVGVNALMKTGEQVWIGTNQGIFILSGSRLTEFRHNKNLPDKTINCILSDSHDSVWIGTNMGFVKISGENVHFVSEERGLIHNEVQTIIEDRRGRIWMGTIGGLVRLDGDTYTDFDNKEGLTFLRINCLAEDPAGNIWIGTFQGGIFRYSDTPDSLPISLMASKGVLSSNNITSILFVNDSTVIAGTDKGFDLLRLDAGQVITRVIHYGLNDGFIGENNTNSIAIDEDDCIWFGTKNGLIRFKPQLDMSYNIPPRTVITDIRLFGQEVNWKERKYSVGRWSNLPEDLILSHKENHLTFVFSGLSFSNPDDLTFSYCLDRKQKNEWLPFGTNRNVPYSDLSPGNYIFKVRAKNKYGITGDITEYSFRIRPPFWQTKAFIATAGVLLLLLAYMLIKSREKKLVKEKIKLEGIVRERTREVVEQKDEISRQRDILTNQQKEIKDSIYSAETIQKAVLPDENLLGRYFSDYFVLFRPKDIVSGDFYWMSEKDDRIIVTAADCTGHGVPGALMSMLGISYLRKIVNEAGIVQPAAILNNLRENIVLSLRQKGSLDTSKDGMDIAICTIDLKNMKLQFAGANNPLFLIRKEKGVYTLITRQGDKMPVGFHSKMSDFTSHELDILKGDTIYMFSDGYYDQFGGPDGRKILKQNFARLLLDNQELDMTSQRTALNNYLDNWINYPTDMYQSIGQIDDIIVLGIRI